MTVTRSFPWKSLSLLLLFAISGLLSFDINKHGSFRDSSTGRFLKDVGALNYCENAWGRVQIYSFQAYVWSLNNLPYYYEKANVVLSPYVEAIKDITCMLLINVWKSLSILAEYTAEKIPVITDTISAYFPGIMEVLESYALQTWDVISYASIEIYKIGISYVMFASEWAMENIFVGNLSPENLHRYTMEALNKTQSLTSQTIAWIEQKL